jgi:hypothetical protein
MGLLFHPTTPALAAATTSKMPLKPLPPQLTAAVSASLSPTTDDQTDHNQWLRHLLGPPWTLVSKITALYQLVIQTGVEGDSVI